jgi:hypothetical protein
LVVFTASAGARDGHRTTRRQTTCAPAPPEPRPSRKSHVLLAPRATPAHPGSLARERRPIPAHRPRRPASRAAPHPGSLARERRPIPPHRPRRPASRAGARHLGASTMHSCLTSASLGSQPTERRASRGYLSITCDHFVHLPIACDQFAVRFIPNVPIELIGSRRSDRELGLRGGPTGRLWLSCPIGFAAGGGSPVGCRRRGAADGGRVVSAAARL